MKLTELKDDFYKRFEPSENFLHFTSCGLLCTLLGHSDIETAPSLTCTLSMRVQMFARRLGGNMVQIQNTSSDKCFSYIFGTPDGVFKEIDALCVRIIKSLERNGLKGAEILFENSIPEFLPYKESFSVALTRSLAKVSDIELTPMQTAAFAAADSDLSQCLALTNSRKGYCTLTEYSDTRLLPLPLSGYKILSAHCKEQDKKRNKAIKAAMEEIRRIYPHAGSVSDLTPELVNRAKSAVKSKTALRYIYHLANENERIKSVCTALRRCDTKTLFREMKISQKSMERFWNLSKEEIFLVRCAENIDGVAALRSWNNGIVAVVEDDMVDYVINTVRINFEDNIGYEPLFCVSDIF